MENTITEGVVTTLPASAAEVSHELEPWQMELRAERQLEEEMKQAAEEAIRLEVAISRDPSSGVDPVKTDMIRRRIAALRKLDLLRQRSTDLMMQIRDTPDRILDADYDRRVPYGHHTGSPIWDMMVDRRGKDEERPSVVFRRSL
jgi:hypothetical protein